MNRDKNIHILLLASNHFKTNNFLHTEALEKKILSWLCMYIFITKLNLFYKYTYSGMFYV